MMYRWQRIRLFVVCLATALGGFLTAGAWCADATPAKVKDGAPPAATESDQKPRTEPAAKVTKTPAEWRKLLTREQFRVTRLKGTEPAFKNAYFKTHTDGIYQCVCCGQPLFDSKAKFESGTGWPSFWEPIDKQAVTYHDDHSEAAVRTEVVCSRCDAHLGHVFGDGPRPTGLRYCMNSVALKLVDRPRTESQGVKTEESKESKRR